MTVYLDHNATAPLRPEAREAFVLALGEWGNPSSVHRYGRAARRLVEEARAAVAALAAAEPAGVVFTSGATEANNLAVKGLPHASLLLSAGEHDSLLAAAPGATRVPLTPQGLVDLNALAELLALAPRPALLAVQAANNETGVIQPLGEIVTLCRQHDAWLHVDAVQVAGRVPHPAWSFGAQSLALSAHKLGGPQGAGALVLLRPAELQPQIQGGGQERRRRAGTENVAALAGFGAAASVALRDEIEEGARLAALQRRLESGLKAISPDCVIFGEAAPRLANTTCFALPGASAETLLIAFDLAGVAISSGSACSSGKVAPSHVLAAMGVPPELAKAALRVSCGWSSGESDVDRFLEVWEDRMRRHRSSAA